MERKFISNNAKFISKSFSGLHKTEKFEETTCAWTMTKEVPTFMCDTAKTKKEIRCDIILLSFHLELSIRHSKQNISIFSFGLFFLKQIKFFTTSHQSACRIRKKK